MLAVDVGGTKLACALVDADGHVAFEESTPTPEGAREQELWETLAALVERVASEAPSGRVRACGIGCGGPMDHDGEEVSPLNIPGWRGFRLRARVEQLTGVATYLDNDAKALALAEGWCGAARGRSDYVAMVVSTGIGGGIVLGGRLLEGRTKNAGHVGHVVVVPEGRRCACGARGCLEAEASGRAIEAMTKRPPAEADAATVERSGTLVGRGIAAVVSLLDLDLAVVAGSVALGFGAPFFAAAQASLSACAQLSFAAGARVVPGGLGPSGPLVGAGAVALRGLGMLPLP